ncbi:MAG: fatty acid desaturase [Planctomycetia bacterium]|mgnify:CR=1 FL=1|nr:fatty acid desaturase [Planctomycetia bacterium]
MSIVTRSPGRTKTKESSPQIEGATDVEDRSYSPPATTIEEDQAFAALEKDRWSRGLDWVNAIWIGFVHVGALVALYPYFFSWKGFGLAVALYWVTGSLGICLGFHRYLTHGGFSTYRPVRWFFGLIGGLAGEGPALNWVAVHRKHHAHSDQAGDPHSPHDGAWWSHMLWLMPNNGSNYYKEMHRRYAPDLLKDPVMRFLDATFLLWHWLLGCGLFAIGYFGWDFQTGCSFVAWGMFVRMCFVMHVTWLVNSATHIWGYTNYKTTDDSKNLWWVGLLAFGEGWHNNHHAFQRMARHGHKWWEIDVTYYAIVALEKVGLAWNVVHDVPQRKRAAGE